MTALPGSPQVQNIIPGQFFGTGSFAGPGIGLLGGALIFGFGLLWLEYRRTVLIRKGETFDSPESARVIGGSSDDGAGNQVTTLEPANRLIPFLPLLTVFAVNFACTLLIFPALDWSYLEDEKFGGVGFDERAGLWAVLLGIIAGVLLLLALNARNFATLWTGCVDGAKRSMLPIFSTASEVGYGAVVASVAAFAVVRDSVFGLGVGALWTSVFSVSITAGLTGSSSGGMTIALNALGDDLRTMAEQEGISMEAMHRLTAMAAGGLDTLPHSGAVVTLLIVCGLTHRQSYKDLGVVTLVVPVIVVVALVGLVSVVGAF
ncbi:GntP family permease [Nocardiopsis sp. MG754419]|nr:GntP family permease [Nocardiopsis sp. MG754419]